MRTFVHTVSRPALLLLVMVALSTVDSPAQGRPADVLQPLPYGWPVAAGPVRDFRAPASPYGAGHRGVDLPVRPGQEVRPMADGIVVWAGTIDGDTWTTVSHRDGIVTSYGPLQAGTVTPLGRPVTTRDTIGLARGDAHDTPGRLHVGARREGRYVDPAALVAGSPPMVATLVGPGQVRADVATPSDRRPPLVPGTPPSPNHLVVLPGLTSSSAGGTPFDLAGLGYGPGTWQQFSYLGVDEDGTPLDYDHAATWGRVHDMALALREQLLAHAAAHPGQAVDLVGHSLGGLVGMYYLLVLHDATDPQLPPVGRIATVASPLQGTDSANAIALARDNPVGAMLLDLVEAHELTPPGTDTPVMHDRMPVLDDLRTSSPAVTAVAEAWLRYRDDPWSSPLATGTDVLTIGTMLDPVVNAHRSSLPGTDHATVMDADLLDSHSNITRDGRTEQLLAGFLGGEPVPTGGWTGAATGAVSGLGSGLVAAVEYALAAGTMALSELAW